MAIEFNCLSCGGALRAGDALVGTRMKCPTCRTELTVPMASAASTGEASAGGPPPAAVPSRVTAPAAIGNPPPVAVGERPRQEVPREEISGHEEPLDVVEIFDAPSPPAPPPLPAPTRSTREFFQREAQPGGVPSSDERAAVKAAALERLLAGDRLPADVVAQAPGPFRDSRPAARHIERETILAGDVLRRAAVISRRHPGLLIAAALFAPLPPPAMAMAIFNTLPPDAGAGTLLTAWIVIGVASFAVQVWLELGFTLVLLKVARGRPARTSDLFGGSVWWPKAVAAGLLSLLGVAAILTPVPLAWLFSWMALQNRSATVVISGVVAAMCGAAATVFALMLSQFPYLLVDRDLGAIDSLRQSMRITQGNKAPLFALAVACAALILASAAVLVASIAALIAGMSGRGALPPALLSTLGVFGTLAGGIALLFAVPYGRLVFAVAYSRMTGQGTADEA